MAAYSPGVDEEEEAGHPQEEKEHHRRLDGFPASQCLQSCISTDPREFYVRTIYHPNLNYFNLKGHRHEIFKHSFLFFINHT